MRWDVKGLLLVCAIFIAILGLPLVMIFALDATLGNTSRIEFASRALQGYVTVVAIIAGGAFAIYRFRIFRMLEPHIVVSQEISHRVVGQSYVHIFVTAMLHNNSKVEVEIRRATFALQMISPMTDFAVEVFDAEASVDGNPSYIQWPTLHEATRTWEESDLTIEPGGSHSEPFEFIISNDVKSVLIYTYFYNSAHIQQASYSRGWGATTVHDIMDE